jgi:hypothetical protein
VSEALVAAFLQARLQPEAAAWLRDGLEAVGRPDAEQQLGGRWSGAGRRLGKATLELDADQEKALREGGAPFVPLQWGSDECGRALLLLAALRAVPAARHAGLVDELYRRGEIRERQAVLRVLAYLPEPARFTEVAVDAVRANALPEIEAIACENPFPARYFPQEAFNQMVLKCLFNGVALRRIEGLGPRRDPELARMVAAFASERRAAGRPVPADAALVLDPDGGTDASV